MAPGEFHLNHATEPADILACLPLLRELRPHLGSDSAVLAQIQRQAQQGYRLLVLRRGGEAVACAGYRISENLVRGRFLYVDDLVAAARERSRGHGERLLNALFAEARDRDCRWLVLDSGVTNVGAHRFYLRHRLEITAFHFAAPLALEEP